VSEISDRLEVVEYVRSLIGTPFGHQGRGPVLDCIGVAYVAAEKFSLADTDMETEKARKYRGYSRFPQDGLLRQACDEYLVKIRRSIMQPADLFLMSVFRVESHIAMLGDNNTIIHAVNLPGRKEVIEHRLSEKWESAIAGCYRFPAFN